MLSSEEKAIIRRVLYEMPLSADRHTIEALNKMAGPGRAADSKEVEYYVSTK